MILLISCSDKRTEQKKPMNEFSENWTEFRTKDSIPKLLNVFLKKINNENFEIANPNERFNSTDIIDSFPRRQLSLLSKKGNSWRLTFIKGGFGKHYVYTECTIKNDSITDFRIAKSLLNLKNNDSIDKYLLNKKLKPTKIKLTMK